MKTIRKRASDSATSINTNSSSQLDHSRLTYSCRLHSLLRLARVGFSGDELRKEGEKLKRRQARQERCVFVCTHELLVRGSVLRFEGCDGVVSFPAGRREGVRQLQAQQLRQRKGVASLGRRLRDLYERRQCTEAIAVGSAALRQLCRHGLAVECLYVAVSAMHC